MYLDFFSFERPPFRITPDPSLFFPGDEHGRGVVLDALIYGITNGEGILKVTGEVGSGKTMLCRMLEEKLPDSVEIVYLANPSLTARDIVYAISFDLKLSVTPETDRLIVMQKLQEYLLQKHSEGGAVVVFIEEAQSMPLETLEEIRLLSNLETHQNKLMQIVLFGQPELDRILLQKSIRQLRERITHSFDLKPLSLEATRDYLRFRLQAAGCPWPQLFHPRAEKMLAAASSGLTRRINILADKALLAAYADPSVRQDARDTRGQIQSMVLPRHVKTAIRDSGYIQVTNWVRPVALGLGALVVILGLGVLTGYFFFSNPPATQATDLGLERPLVPVNPVSGSERALTPEESISTPPEPAVVPGELPLAGIPAPAEAVLAVPAGSQEQVTESPAELTHPLMTETGPGTEAIATLAVVQAAPAAAESLPEPVPLAPAGPEVATTVPETTSEPAPKERPAMPELSLSDEVTAFTGSPPADRGAQPAIIEARLAASRDWFATMPGQGYTVQLLSVSANQDFILRDFLGLMNSNDLLQESYICELSVSEPGFPDRLVVYGEFQGLSLARQFISSLPDEVAQYAPFVRNLNDISCLNR